MRIDLNADLGEGIGDDAALLDLVSSANVATGAHAGGGRVLRDTVAKAVGRGVRVGAHPSYPDRETFGRRSHSAALRADPAARQRFARELVEQVLDVGAQVERHGWPLAHVKPHGALYNDAVADPLVADVVVDAVAEAVRRCGYSMAVVTQPDSALARSAGRASLPVVAEGFADRAYAPDGRLMPRESPGAVHGDVAAMVDQALGLAEGRVVAADGSRIPMQVASVCVHGDTPGAVGAAGAVRSALLAAGHDVQAPHPSPWAFEPVAIRLRQALARRSLGPAAEIRPFGDRALLVQPADEAPAPAGWVHAMARATARAWPEATVVPGLASVLADGGPGARASLRWHPVIAALLAAQLRGQAGRLGDGAADPLDDGAPQPVRHVLPTRYDGPDLTDVAALLGVPTSELVARHSGADWTVEAVGFSPGFGYLTCADPLFADLPRRSDPRPRVPAGSVALAARMCAVYPSAGPGGWQLVGRTEVALFDPAADRPARLRPGDRAQFVAAD